MEIGIILLLTIVVVAVKGMTMHWLGQLTIQIRDEEAEEVEVLQRVQATEAAKLQLEREVEALGRDRKLLEHERNMVALDIQKMGAEPLPESSVDEEEAAGRSGAHAPGDVSGTAEPGEDAASETEPGETSGPAEVIGRPGKRRILVVDDNEDLRELLQQVLSQGYEVSGASDGYEALTRMIKGKERFDLVVTDLKMPNVNGIALMESLPKDVPVIVISGYVDQGDFKKALQGLAPVAVLSKPFRTGELREAIQRALPEPEPAEPEPVDGADGADGDETPQAPDGPFGPGNVSLPGPAAAPEELSES